MKKLTAILTSLIMTLSVICQTSVFAAFSDVGDDNTYKDAITTLTKLKVIDGYEDGTFKPDGQITRAEFTKLIVFILGYKDLAYDSSDFTDVDASHWAKNYIQTAYNLGIIAGKMCIRDRSVVVLSTYLLISSLSSSIRTIFVDALIVISS